ncbi:diacylglycerol kinase family enzyme [Stackebrandtia endophytica]|uniref:Diacylglycerol kinase family enzyme n=1 Tax=Stackebrandtia endophytica TaxID=1496996 RepID=A0A543AT67_9ACTN|nr:diacylglycerol kinase family protein [Stackebrandtia endophytica]TQL75758.1 diacylglycerol kinase family enzyme [Stackebrandtia endophytica]
MSTHVAIVWNPSKTSREELEAAVPTTDIALSWHSTTPDDPGSTATRDALASGATVVVAAGGDGTVRAVAEQLARERSTAELVVVPMGTGNLLARNLDIPLGDVSAALGRAFDGTQARRLDLGWIETDLDGEPRRLAFAVMAGIGIDAHMITETDDDLKDKAGWLAYVESLGRALKASELIDISISFDGAAPATVEAHTMLIGNCGTIQAGITLLPDADPCDGELNLLLLSADSIGQWLDTLRAFAWDNGIRKLLTGEKETQDADTATHVSARTISVSLPEPRVLEIDGDDLGEVTAVSIQTQPDAIRIR